MAERVDVAEALRQRMANQGLATRAAADAQAATRQSAGIQAQDLWASRLAVRARARHVDLADVIASTQAPALIARSWLMRGTLHMVAAEDLRWLTALFGPRIEAMIARRLAELDLTGPLLDHVAETLPGLVRGTALTRAELVAALRDAGVAVPAQGQAPAYITLWASLRGLICRGAEQRSEPTYVLMDDWILPAPARSEDEAMVELVRRYLRAFGPATVGDFVAWSRLTVAATRPALAALGDEVHTWSIQGEDHFLLDPVPTSTGAVRLLPAFDTYVMGYRRRHLFLDPARHTDILEGGIIHPMIVLDGVIVGTWRLDRAARPAVVNAEFFVDIGPDTMDAVEDEAVDVGRFLGGDCILRVVDRISRRRPRPSPAVRV